MSDTHDHIERAIKALNILLDRGIDTVIHLGDIISPFMPRFMWEKAIRKDFKLVAVRGNNDGDINTLSKRFSENGWTLYSDPTIVNINGRRLFIMHGYGSADLTEDIAIAIAKSMEDIDAVLYGHTHRIKAMRINNKLVLNPGEVCGYLTGKASVAILNTSDLSVEIIELS